MNDCERCGQPAKRQVSNDDYRTIARSINNLIKSSRLSGDRDMQRSGHVAAVEFASAWQQSRYGGNDTFDFEPSSRAEAAWHAAQGET